MKDDRATRGTGDRSLAAYFEELKERRVIRSAALYAAGAFVLLQVADLIVPALTFLPPWTYTGLVVLTLVGFPFAMVFAWVYDVTSEGLRKTDESFPSGLRLGRTATFVLGASLSVLLSAAVTSRLEPPAPVVADLTIPESTMLPEEGELRDTWVVVAPFVDQSGDTELSQISNIAAQWISEGLVGTGQVTVAPLDEEAIDAALEESGLEGRAERILWLAERRGARRAITGSYSALGSELRVAMQILDVQEGNLVYSITAESSVSEPQTALDPLRNDAMTFLVADVGDGTYSLSPSWMPGYDAYVELLNAEAAFFRQWRGRGGAQQSVDHAKRALELDPRLGGAAAYGLIAWQSYGGALDASPGAATLEYFTAALDAWEPDTEYQRAVKAYTLNGGPGGQLAERYWGVMKMFELRPERTLVLGATLTAFRFNRPGRALEIHDWNRRNFDGSATGTARSLHALGRYEEALAVLREDDLSGQTVVAELEQLAALGRSEEVLARIDDVYELSTGERGLLNSLSGIGHELAAHGYPQAAYEFWTRIVNEYPDTDWRRSELLLLLGREEEAAPLIDTGLEAALAEEPRPVVVQRLGEHDANLLLGDRWRFLEAMADLQRGDERAGRDYLAHLDRAEHVWSVEWANAAALEAARGNLEAAVRYLRRDPNYWFGPNTHRNPWLVPLHDERDYQDWIRPKG